jgi:hypothetical protein
MAAAQGGQVQRKTRVKYIEAACWPPHHRVLGCFRHLKMLWACWGLQEPKCCVVHDRTGQLASQGMILPLAVQTTAGSKRTYAASWIFRRHSCNKPLTHTLHLTYRCSRHPPHVTVVPN